MMTGPNFYSLRVRLLVFVLLVLIPSTALMFYNASERRRDAADEVRRDAQRLIERTTGECQRLLDGAEDLLRVLVETPEVRSLDCPASEALFKRILHNDPHYINIGLADVNGHMLCSAAPMKPGISIGDRGYFRRTVARRGFAVGEYQIGRIIGKPSVNVGYPLLDGQGRVRGVLFAALDLGFLRQLAAGLGLPAGANFTIADRNGTVVLRHPRGEKWVGKPFTDLPEGQTVLRRGSGVADIRDGQGEMRQYVFGTLTEGKGGIDAHVSVGVPHSVVFARINRSRMRSALILTAVAILTLLAAAGGANSLVLKRVRALWDATQRVAAGDLTVRTGMGSTGDELGRLAMAFDEMTQSLQEARRNLLASERERQRVYTQVIRAVTHDRFRLVAPGGIPDRGRLVAEMTLASPDDYTAVRRRLREIARGAGMHEENVTAIVQAAGEAVTNALKHASQGICRVYLDEGAMIVRVSDEGAGIHAEDLAATILTPGFSTKVSLGMGYTIMVELSDCVWLATGPEGTTVQVEKSFAPRPDLAPGLLAAMERF